MLLGAGHGSYVWLLQERKCSNSIESYELAELA
jgi:hypothetical protein